MSDNYKLSACFRDFRLTDHRGMLSKFTVLYPHSPTADYSTVDSFALMVVLSQNTENRKSYIINLVRIRLLLILIVVILLPHTTQMPLCSEEAVCVEESPSIVISKQDEKLYLCNGTSIDYKYEIAVGEKGWGKKREGDKKTPIGEYVIGEPRPSKRFYIFIPIGYPTLDQKTQGYTGSDIGIHGPWQPLKWLGRLNNLVNWTQGCIAVGRNSDIKTISLWIKDKKPEHIHIQ